MSIRKAGAIIAGAGAGGGMGGAGVGAGGGLVGQSNGNGEQIVIGGTQTEPGYYYYVSYPNDRYNYGHFGGGNYFEISDITTGSYAGGAGSGWYGGGSNLIFAAGGSSYTHPSMCSNVIHTQGYSSATGNGWLIITPLK